MDGLKGRDASRVNTVHVYCTIHIQSDPDYVGLSFPKSHSLTDPRFLYSISISPPPPADHWSASVPATPKPVTLLLPFFFSFPLFSTSPSRSSRFRSALSAIRCLVSSSIASQPTNSALLMSPVAGMFGAT